MVSEACRPGSSLGEVSEEALDILKLEGSDEVMMLMIWVINVCEVYNWIMLSMCVSLCHVSFYVKSVL